VTINSICLVQQLLHTTRTATSCWLLSSVHSVHIHNCCRTDTCCVIICFFQAELLSRHIVKFEAIVRDLEAPPVAVAAAAQAAY
jgi:hypothetical protein